MTRAAPDAASVSPRAEVAAPPSVKRAPARLLSHVLMHVLPATILVLIGISIAEAVLIRRTFEAEVHQRLRQQATQVAAAISVKVQALVAAAAAVAENDLVVNGLIDFEERLQYIPVYFQRLQLPGPSGILVSLTDYRGRTLASNAPAPSYQAEPWVPRVMTGERLTRIDRDGMLLALPVTISGRPEGIVVVELDRQTLAELLAVPVLVGAMAIKAPDGSVVFSSDPDFLPPSADGLVASQWVAVETRVPFIPELQFIAAELRREAFASVTQMYQLTGVAVVFAIVAVTLGIVATAWLTAKPIARFADDIGRISGVEGLSHRARPSGFAELHSLALSFNIMLERLERTTTSRDYVDSILNSISEMILVTGEGGRIRSCNRAFRRMMGGEPDAFVGRPIADILADGQAGLRRLVRGETAAVEGTLITAAGRPLPVQISATRMTGDGADGADRIFVLMNMTERKEAERLLRQRAEELARSNAELQQFASVASHDLQEPLRKVQAFSERLHGKYHQELDEQGRDYLARIAAATGRMQTLIVDLLAFSQVGRGELRAVPVDLAEIVRSVVSDLEVRIQETGGRVEVQTLPTISADPLQMRQLFQNLIGNGLKYRREGVPPVVRVTATRPRDGAGCVIEVSDNGIGFEQEYAERIFGIFQRLHGRSAYEGTGVGLAICRKICERHGGRIAALGRPGGGATFTVTLPGGDPVRKVA